MSTRSMTLLESAHGVRIYLYRHCDGYPACAGDSILQAIERAGGKVNAARVAAELLADKEASYELADWKPEDRGDLEHVYHVREGHELSAVVHFARKPCDDTPYTDWPNKAYSIIGFRVFVGFEVAEMLRRAAEFRARVKLDARAEA